MDTINPTSSSQIYRPRRLDKHVIGCNAYVTYNNTRDRGPGWLLDSRQYLKITKTEFQSNPSRIAWTNWTLFHMALQIMSPHDG